MERIRNQDSQTEQIDRQIEVWKKAPIILASGSRFRLEQLEDYGFSDVSAAEPIPEQVESETASQMQASGQAPSTHHDGDGRNFSEHIAAAKVSYVINNQKPDPGTLIIGFDTTPVIYEKPTQEQIMGTPSSSEKYTNLEEARQGIFAQFKTISAGCIETKEKMNQFEKIQREIGGSEEDIQQVLNGALAGQRRGKIYVQTGVAVATPQEHDLISHFTDEVQLYSDSIAATDGNEQALEILVEQTLEQMGDRVFDISGGVDYSDSYIRDLLGIKEITLSEHISEEKLYQGFPTQALTAALSMRAGTFAVAAE